MSDLKYERLKASRRLQNEAIIRHYSSITAVTVHLNHLLELKQFVKTGRQLQEIDDLIESQTSVLRDRHFKDLGIKLEWENYD